MATNDTSEPLHIGTFCTLLYSRYGRVKIVEYRGPLGPGGMRIYRVRVPSKPKPIYIEVREDQLKVLPPDAATEPSKPGLVAPPASS